MLALALQQGTSGFGCVGASKYNTNDNDMSITDENDDDDDSLEDQIIMI